jgi:hypothetical protein
MVESGNYDQALRYGVDKLRGEKNKKTKYVKGLEKAYAKLNLRDQSKINHLKLSGQRNSLDRIVDLYKVMEQRQDYVLPLLPLISEDDYLAKIKIKDYSVLINEASREASEKHYTIAIKYLESARQTNNRLDARSAYTELEEAQYYFTDYKDSYDLKKEAYELGQSRILIEAYAKGSNIAFEHTMDIINEIGISKLNTKWEKFYMQDNGNIPFNYIATIEVSDIMPGLERERYDSYTETKTIVDGKIPFRNRSGTIMRDTSGNIIYNDKFKEVEAYIEELRREKIAKMNGRIVIIDALDNTLINSVPINITHEFRDYSRTYKGDQRALPTNKILKSRCDVFPSDYEITSTMAYAYKAAAEESLNNQFF